MKKIFLFAISICFITVLIISLNFANAAEDLSKGSGVYQFAETTGVNNEPINIYYYRPQNWKVGDKIFVIFHGQDRGASVFINGTKNIKGLAEDAESKNVLLICPELTKEKYPGDRYYNFGFVMTNHYKTLNPRSQWTYNVVNRIIDDVIKRTNSNKSKIILFGHSAGGQFMHRYLFFADKLKADRVIAANSGVYFMPDENVAFPRGLKNVPITDKELKRAYKKDAIILLGENDVKRTRSFPQTPADDKQGLNRLERGKNFYAKTVLKAQEIGVKLNWQLITVPDVGHSGIKMARRALKYID